MKKHRFSGGLSASWPLAICILLTLAMGIAGYVQVPTGTAVAIHFNLSGEPNGWATPGKAFFAIPLVEAMLLVLQWAVPVVKPSADRIEKRIVAVMFGIVAVVLAMAQAYLLSRAI